MKRIILQLAIELSLWVAVALMSARDGAGYTAAFAIVGAVSSLFDAAVRIAEAQPTRCRRDATVISLAEHRGRLRMGPPLDDQPHPPTKGAA